MRLNDVSKSSEEPLILPGSSILAEIPVAARPTNDKGSGSNVSSSKPTLVQTKIMLKVTLITSYMQISDILTGSKPFGQRKFWPQHCKNCNGHNRYGHYDSNSCSRG